MRFHNQGGRLALLAGLILGSAALARGNGLLFDFGADGAQTTGGATGPAVSWNNVTGIGTDDFGLLEGLLATDGTASGINIQMVARFNGVNESGTAASPLYPATATRDSLYGNTELFGGLENIAPVFKLTGLQADATYTLTFYASRSGVTDNRETRYTVTGAAERSVDLDAANNVTNTAQVSAVAPDGAGEIMIALTPGPNNNNGNHFTYLGVLQIQDSGGAKYLVDFGAAGSMTEVVETPPGPAWNNVTTTIGTSATGTIDGLVTTNGTATAMNLAMVSRFNGVNENGSTAATVFPASATRDSLFGNTETFNGQANVLPSFKLTGLDPNYTYTFTFYGSRNGVSDNRETRYTVSGTSSAHADLNTANNTNTTTTVSAIRPTESGEIALALSPGPNNNNGNHFTYLGAMKVDYAPVRTPRVLIDFGAAGRPTEIGTDDPDNYWNNVTTTQGSSDTGSLTNLVKTDGNGSGIALQMVSRFNGANENGTEAAEFYPIDATRDSLFGNTELFSGLENVTPIFKLTGLNPATDYRLQFFASRMGVGDNRETRYTVTGAAEQTADLNAANNETEFATVTAARPNSAGEIAIALAPGPNNDNGNHFVYLGVLDLAWTASGPGVAPVLSEPEFAGGQLSFLLTGTAGKTYKIQRTSTFAAWEDLQNVTLTGASQSVQAAGSGAAAFYRAVEQ